MKPHILCRILIMALASGIAVWLSTCAPQHAITSGRAADTQANTPAIASNIVSVPSPHSSPALSPHAIIYKTSGDFSSNVSVDLSGDRSYIVGFPAVSDITADSAPIALTDGYYLDRHGIRPTSAFLTYTYDEYRAMSSTPQPSSILDHVIPGSHVTDIVEMPFDLSDDIAADTARCNKFIRDGLPGCHTIFPTTIG